MRTLRFSIIVDMKGVEKGGFLEYTNKTPLYNFISKSSVSEIDISRHQ